MKRKHSWNDLAPGIHALYSNGSPATRRALERAVFKLVQDHDRLLESHESLVATLEGFLNRYEINGGPGFHIPGLPLYRRFLRKAKRLA